MAQCVGRRCPPRPGCGLAHLLGSRGREHLMYYLVVCVCRTDSFPTLHYKTGGYGHRTCLCGPIFRLSVCLWPYFIIVFLLSPADPTVEKFRWAAAQGRRIEQNHAIRNSCPCVSRTFVSKFGNRVGFLTLLVSWLVSSGLTRKPGHTCVRPSVHCVWPSVHCTSVGTLCVRWNAV